MVPFHLRTIQGLEAQLLGCSYYPNLLHPSASGRGSVHLDYLLEARRLNVVEHIDDDPDGPLIFTIKPYASRWTTELIADSEYAVLRTEDGRRFSSVNWKTHDGVVMRVEPTDMVAGIDEALLVSVLDSLR